MWRIAKKAAVEGRQNSCDGGKEVKKRGKCFSCGSSVLFFLINNQLNSIIQQEKLQKAALKAEEAERKKLDKEKQKWEKGKLALKSIVAEIDTKVVEESIGGKEFLLFFCIILQNML